MALKLKAKADEATAADETLADTPSGHTWPSPAKPSAMLVPTYIRENRALAVTRRKVWYGVIAVVALVVLAVAAAFMATITSKGSLDDAVSAKESARNKVDRLSPIATYYDGLEQRTQATVALLANDIRHADLFDFVNTSMPPGTSIESYNTNFGTPCASGDPFVATEAIGCINILAVTDTKAKVAATLAAINRAGEDAPVKGAFVTGIKSRKGSVEFSLNLNFTPDALSMKYVPKDQQDQVKAQQGPATPTQDGAQ